ncbi:MAG: hypothetical protein NTU66_06090 [Elusimicrobia bacterium]|nr:hypothetical protein [Elusimicrobiota bacterium]
MKSVLQWIVQNWIWLALVSSVIWGLYGAKLFSPKNDDKLKQALIIFYQFNFNFIGSFAGWCCFHILTVRLKAPYAQMAGTDLLLGALTVLGLTGHLPESIYGLVISVKKLGEAVADRLIKAGEK